MSRGDRFASHGKFGSFLKGAVIPEDLFEEESAWGYVETILYFPLDLRPVDKLEFKPPPLLWWIYQKN